jgi:signal transduction histidine kinase
MSLRARLRLSIVALVAIVVVAISALYLYDFTELAFKTATARADHIALQVKGYVLDRIEQQMAARAGRPLTLDESKSAWADIVKTDPHIKQMLEHTLAIADPVVSIHISGEDGTTLAASSPHLVGGPAPIKANLRDIERRNPILTIWDLFRKREDYTTTLPLGVPEQRQPIFRITVVIRSVLLANTLSSAFWNFGMVFISSLVIALFIASVLPNLVLSPLERVSQRIDLIRTGQFEAMPLVTKEDSREFADVQSKLSLLGQQFRGARQDALELRSNIDDLLQRLEEAVLLFDPAGRLMMAGDPVARFLGKDREELIGHKLDELFPSSTVLGALIHRAIERHQPVHDRLVTLGPEGTNPARLLVNVEILRKGPAEQEIGTLITLRDAETRRQLELQLDVSSRLAAISRLTGGIAHEIKNPLNAMALHLEVLKTKLDAAEPEIDVIAREIKRLDHVVKTFLNFNKPIELERHVLDLAELASEVVDLVRPDAESKNIRVDTGLNEPRWINGDTDLLRQAVLNVVVNAIDAMKDSGTLTVRGEQNDRECVLIVADTGPGIPAQIRDKIFNLYFSTKESGSGMGLAMTFRAVQLHSGTIDVSSEPGHGTSFHLRFPRVAREHDAEPVITRNKPVLTDS